MCALPPVATTPGNTCGYWDFLQFERAGQKDDEYVSTTWHDED
jgi:hypothetical protein